MNKSGIFVIVVSIVIGITLAYQIIKPELTDTEPPKVTIPDTFVEIEGIDIDEPESIVEEVVEVSETTPEVITELEINTNTMQQVTIKTNKGDITIELFENDAPNTVANFLKLTNDGFYNGVIFHRVISGFMIQGGDPTGTGTGGPGYKFDDELDASTESYKRGYLRGTLAMANAGPNTNGSQFFIMHQDYALPNAYTIFGRVTDGMDVVDIIAASDVDGRDKPLSEVVMESVTVVK